MLENKELILEIRNKIQFITTIAIFFSGVVYYFFNIYDKDNANKIALSCASLVIIYLLSYIFFDLLKNRINGKFLELINILTLAGIGIFVFPILYLASLKNELTVLDSITLKISLLGLLIVPGLIFLLIIFGGIYNLPNKKLGQ